MNEYQSGWGFSLCASETQYEISDLSLLHRHTLLDKDGLDLKTLSCDSRCLAMVVAFYWLEQSQCVNMGGLTNLKSV